jgi:hypothetical protein
MNVSELVVVRQLDSLRGHPENETIFGSPEDSEDYEAIKASIRKNGLWDPVVIRKDGTILSGHLRVAVLKELGKKEVPCRVASFESYREEVVFLVRSNTDRRQLTREQVAFAFHRLKSLPPEQGGVKKERGRPKGITQSVDKAGASSGIIDTGDSRKAAAEVLKIGYKEAEALEAVFMPEDVPAELKAAVNSGKVAPTPAAKAVQTERKRQGGTITDPTPLKAWAEAKVTKKPVELEDKRTDHEKHVQAEAEAFRKDLAELVTLYKKADEVLRRRPLKSVIGPTEHHEYAALIRDTSLLYWRQIESVQGDTNVGKQMALAVIQGGKS